MCCVALAACEELHVRPPARGNDARVVLGESEVTLAHQLIAFGEYLWEGCLERERIRGVRMLPKRAAVATHVDNGQAAAAAETPREAAVRLARGRDLPRASPAAPL